MAKELTYWEKRMEQLFKSQDKKDAKYDKSMRKEYLRVEEQIKKEIASYYANYGKDGVIEYRKLVQSLSQKERDLLYQNYEEFARRNPKYVHLMPIRESIYQLNRLEGLQLSVRMRMVELGAFEEEGFQKLLEEAYENGYLSSMKGLQNAPTFFTVNGTAMQLTLSEKWINNGNFSDRIWGNKERLINLLNTEIRDAIIRGDDYKKMSRLLEHRMGVGAYDSRRLIVTESAFVLNQSNKQAFMDAGILRYEITAVLDSKTSPTCRELNGEIFEFKAAKVGVNYPPFHAFCRTTVVPIENGVSIEKLAAGKMIQKAREHEPTVTSDLITIASVVGVYLKGLEYKLKSEGSLARKIKSEGDNHIRDVLRYTAIADPDILVDSYFKMVEMLKRKGYTETVVKNYWINPHNPYNGINTFVKNSRGYEFELQYHTEESFNLKDGKLHELYEKWRVIEDKSSKEAVSLAKEMAELSAKLKRPKNIEKVR